MIPLIQRYSHVLFYDSKHGGAFYSSTLTCDNFTNFHMDKELKLRVSGVYIVLPYNAPKTQDNVVPFGKLANNQNAFQKIISSPDQTPA
jgi:hypothetical protein